MSNALSLPRGMSSRALCALLLAAAAVAATFALAVPDRASAGTGACASGDFCLWQHINYDGGRYNWSGSDSTLYNDKFVGTNVTVANNGSSLRNNGQPATYDDVRVYYFLNQSTPSLCVPRGRASPTSSATTRPAAAAGTTTSSGTAGSRAAEDGMTKTLLARLALLAAGAGTSAAAPRRSRRPPVMRPYPAPSRTSSCRAPPTAPTHACRTARGTSSCGAAWPRAASPPAPPGRLATGAPSTGPTAGAPPCAPPAAWR